MNAKMNKELDDVLKECLMQDLEIVGEKVYKKIAGLPNLGRTYFYKQSEVNDKNQFAQDQMVNRYGSEMYGINAQLGNQSSTETAASTGNSGSSNATSLISCKCTAFLKIPDKYVKESSRGVGYQQFQQAWENLQEWVKGKSENDKDWKSSHESSWEKILGYHKKMNGRQPAKDKMNKENWENIANIFNKEPWDKEIKNDKELNKLLTDLKGGYTSWDVNGGSSQDGNSPTMGSSDDNSWDPNLTFKIDVHTSFDDKWFMRKFKSGMLNKLLFTIKTGMRSRGSATPNGEWDNHKYKSDEMLPQDKRKLDSMQWKMTNKVAKDYITLLLGWSREKTKYEDTQGMQPTQELQQDSGFGKSMAKKALSNRGILGRLKQKIFSGQQSNNLISVVFQLADPNDYTTKPRKEQNAEINTTGNEGGESENGQNDNNQVNESISCSTGFTLKLSDEDMDRLLIESFEEEDDDNGRMSLVHEVCYGSEKVDKLIEDCILDLV